VLFDEAFFHQVYAQNKENHRRYANPSDANQQEVYVQIPQNQASRDVDHVCERQKRCDGCLSGLRQLRKREKRITEKSHGRNEQERGIVEEVYVWGDGGEAHGDAGEHEAAHERQQNHYWK